MPIDLESYVRSFNDLPESPMKERWLEVYNEFIVHSRGVKPNSLIDKNRPNEDDKIKDYRLDNYRPITQRGVSRAVDKLSVIFQETEFNVTVSDILSDYLKEVRFNTDGFDNLTYLEFIKKIIIPSHIEDPNAVLLVIPMQNVEVNERLQPTLKLVPSKDILHLNEEIFTFLSNEKSLVTKGDKQIANGSVYWVITKDVFAKLVQFGEESKKQFRLEIQLEHGLGEIPIAILGGVATRDDETNGIYYKSFFDAYNALANEAIVAFSEYQAVRVLNAFPVKEMQSIECTQCNGLGKLEDSDGNDKTQRPCTGCNGTGSMLSLSPYDVLMRKEENNATGENTSGDMLKYHTPPVDILKHVEETWTKLQKGAEEALNLIFVDEAQSGVAKEIDREEQDGMLRKIGDNLFDNIMYKSLMFMELFLNTNPEEPVITKPVSYRVKTETDLTKELNSLVESDSPTQYVREVTKDLTEKRFGNDKVAKKKINISMSYDALFGKTSENKRRDLLAGVVSKEMVEKSTLTPFLIDQLEEEKGSDFLLNSEMSDIEQELDILFDNERQTTNNNQLDIQV